jgi:hypothetical protein
MKKLIAIFAVLLLAAPAMAADWSFYGSQRVATFWVSDDFGDATVAGEDDDWGLQWNFQTNSRLGARVKADKVTGHIELGLKGTDGGDLDVGTRRAYGLWKFSDMATLKVGKDYSPVTRFLSGQVFGEDIGLLGLGDFYGRRPGMLGLTIGGFDIALITNALNTTNLGTAAQLANTDPDWNLPKLEASWMLKFGSFDIRPFGGVQWFKLSQAGSTFLTDDIDILSYVVGIDSMLNIGAFYVGGQFSYGQNWSNANWSGPLAGGTFGSFATLDGTEDTNDTISWMAMLVAGLKFTPTLTFEVGGGFRQDDPDVDGAEEDQAWTVYGQAVITLAPGVFLVPEIGYLDKMDNVADVDEGSQWYAGAKWQIDF